MRTRFATTTLLALLALPACGGVPAAMAADTGGASSPPPAGAPTGSTAPAGATKTPAHTRKPPMASWFGPGFYGHRTACGQTMTPVIVGVANRTLPCGTLVKFSYAGHQLTVPVLDRGPYAKGVNWDLTAAAAQALGVQETVPILTSVVGQAANTPTLGVPAGAPALEAAGGTSAG
jgi:rare lipoprotein A (peptidoglycan hydrolase)